jgi:hypothetical protein
MAQFGMADVAFAKNPEYANLFSLETLRVGEIAAMNTNAALYYLGEENKVSERGVEQASEYHFIGMASGVPIPANPFEMKADFAVELMKGAPGKASEWFSPVSGMESAALPDHSLGLQGWAWNVALNRDNSGKYPAVGAVSFMPGIQLMESMTGKYGPYGSLFGGPEYIGTPSSAGVRAQAPFNYTPDAFAAVNTAIAAAHNQHGITTQGVFGFNAPAVNMNPLPMTGAVTPSSDRLIGGKTVAGMATTTDIISGLPMPFISHPPTVIAAANGVNFQDYYAGQQAAYTSELNAYQLGGSSDAEIYKDLQSRQKQLTMLGEANVGLEMSKQMADQFFAAQPSQPAPVKTPSFTDMLVTSAQKGLVTGFTMGGINPAGGMAVDTGFALLEGKPQNMPGYSVISDIQSPNDIFTKVMAVNTDINRLYAPYSTDIVGIGRMVENIPSMQGTGIVPEIANTGKSYISELYQSPVTIAEMYGVGAAIGIGEGALMSLTAKSAESSLPVISQLGRAASTPLAADLFTVAKTAGFGYLMYGSVVNAASQPTAEKRGAAYADITAAIIGGAGGYRTPNEPANYYAGREFFSGNLGMGPIEKLQFFTESRVRSLFAENPSAYREVADVSTMIPRFTEPTVRQEPDFTELTRAGPYAKDINTVLSEQPSVAMGSSIVKTQYPQSIIDSVGIRTGKDVDALVRSPSQAITRLSGLTGLSEEGATSVLDAHGIPRGYPGFEPSTEPDKIIEPQSIFNRLFGEQFRNIAFPRGSSEVITTKEPLIPSSKVIPKDMNQPYEAIQVQFGRKAEGAAKAIADPLGRGYRAEKDIADFVTLYSAQKEAALSKGVIESAFSKSDGIMKDFMDKEITYATEKGNPATMVTRSVRNIYEAQRGNPIKVEPPGANEPSVLSSFARATGPAGVSSLFNNDAFKSILDRSSSIASNSPVFRSSISSPSPRSNPSPGSPSSLSGSPSSLSVSRSISPPTSLMSILQSPKPSGIQSPSILRSPPSLSPSPSYSPPSSPPYSPPSSPPYSPPSYVPPSIPYIPPPSYVPPSGIGSGGGGDFGSGLLGFRGHPYKNKIVDIPYMVGLSKRFSMGFNTKPRSNPLTAKKRGGKK